MILEVKQWPESQEVMEDPDWFWISDDLEENNVIGSSAYARVMDEREYILVEETTADELNICQCSNSIFTGLNSKTCTECGLINFDYNDYEEAKAAHESEKYRYPNMHVSVMEFECSKCKDIVPDSEYEDPYCLDCK